MLSAKEGRHRELAHFLRSRRERVRPEEVGLPVTVRRRTPGLRRSEVAMLAGVSLDWYTYLEQGRNIQASVGLLEELATILKLNSAERRHLFLLARQQEPPEIAHGQSAVTPQLLRLLENLVPAPGCLIDACMNVVAWNTAFSVVFGDLSKSSERDRNMLWVTFDSAEFRSMKGDEWEEHAKALIAQVHSDYAKYIGNSWWTEQIEVLMRQSNEFRRLWEQHDVLQAPNMAKRIHHPIAGVLNFDYMVLVPPGTEDLQVSIHLPNDDGATVAKINELLSFL